MVADMDAGLTVAGTGAGDSMVMVSISETYDLHTVVNKMTLIGIHTPKKELIQKTYPGLCMNFKKFRIHHVDCVLSTAQQLPLGVSEIGLDADQIRPQDMMNPILYKAVSNESWSTLEARLNGLMFGNAVVPPVQGNMAIAENDGVAGLADEHPVYYSLLSNRDGFRFANPQQGVEMRNLVPLVFQKLYTNAVVGDTAAEAAGVTPGIAENAEGNLEVGGVNIGTFRGHATPMPWINTTYVTGISGGTRGVNYQANGMDDGSPLNGQIQMPDIPPVMLGCILLPPVTATTGILYYRMTTRAFIEFSDVRPITEITYFSDMATRYSTLVYHSDYANQSKNMDDTTDMVDIKNGSIEKIMEGR